MLDVVVKHDVIFGIKGKTESVSLEQFQTILDSADENGLVSTMHVEKHEERCPKKARE